MKLLIYKLIILPISYINKKLKKIKKNTDDVLMVFLYGHMGDYLVMAGAIERFKRMNPERKLSIICADYNENIVKESGSFEKIYVANKKRRVHFFLSDVFKIKAKDLIVIPPNYETGFFLEYVVTMIVTDNKIAARNHLVANYSDKMKATYDSSYSTLIEISEIDNITVRTDEFFYRIVGKVIQPYLYSLKEHVEYRENRSHYFSVNLGSALLSKCWPTDRFAEVIEYVNKKTGLVPYFIGGKMEAELVEKLKKYYSGPFENYCCKTSVHELINLIGNAAFYFGNDTGTTHIAAAAETPGFSITSYHYLPNCLPYPADYTGNKDAFPIAIYSLKDKSACKYCAVKSKGIMTESCKKCIDEKGCMECVDEITVEQVIDVLEKSGILEKYQQKR